MSWWPNSTSTSAAADTMRPTQPIPQTATSQGHAPQHTHAFRYHEFSQELFEQQYYSSLSRGPTHMPHHHHPPSAPRARRAILHAADPRPSSSTAATPNHSTSSNPDESPLKRLRAALGILPPPRAPTPPTPPPPPPPRPAARHPPQQQHRPLPNAPIDSPSGILYLHELRPGLVVHVPSRSRRPAATALVVRVDFSTGVVGLRDVSAAFVRRWCVSVGGGGPLARTTTTTTTCVDTGPGALAYVHYTEVRKMRCSGAYVMPRVGAQDVKVLERMLDAEERG